MPTASRSSEGRITIPVEIRNDLKLNAGDRVEFARGRYVFVLADSEVTALKAMFGPVMKAASIGSMNAAIAKRGAAARLKRRAHSDRASLEIRRNMSTNGDAMGPAVAVLGVALLLSLGLLAFLTLRLRAIIGRPIYDIVAPEYLETYRQNMARVFSSETLIYAFRSISLKGKVPWLETHAVPMRDVQMAVRAVKSGAFDLLKNPSTTRTCSTSNCTRCLPA